MNCCASLFRFDQLSNFIGIFVIFFFVVTCVYSVGFMKKARGLMRYYSYLALTLLASLGAVFSADLIVFMVCWGFLGFLLYVLIGYGQKKNTPATAKKTLIIIGGTDALMLLGVALIWHNARTFRMDEVSIAFSSKSAIAAYLCLAAGAFAKAGAMPFHTWVPDTAEDAPVPVTAFLPASIDKLLGIYFLTRLSLDMFVMDGRMNAVLMFAGSFTIVAAVMMALVQHDLKKLLGYHAVSQVGYMVLAIGTGIPIGIAGGLFHMVNNAIYKSCLFLCGGAVEKQSGTTDLDKLGGLANAMPFTFIIFLIASLSISGVPPFNGFVSKWMVYQGIVETAKNGGYIWVVWLVAAMFGSALTLASFMKLIHAVFLGQPSLEQKQRIDTREAPVSMLIPAGVLAALCVVFGVWAYRIPLALFILPSVPESIAYSGVWNAGLATVLIVAGIIIGIGIYFLGTITKVRATKIFIGGEDTQAYPEMRVSGTGFYNTIQEYGILKTIYSLAQAKVFDIYEVGSKITFGLSAVLRFLHNGVLLTYLAWCLLGMAAIFYLLLK